MGADRFAGMLVSAVDWRITGPRPPSSSRSTVRLPLGLVRLSLRIRLLALFLVLGVLPLLAVGALTNARNLKAVEALVEGEAGAVARAAAQEVSLRLEGQRGPLLFLAENTETRRLLSGDAATPVGSPETVAYLEGLMDQLGPRYASLDVVDASGRSRLSAGSGTVAFAASPNLPSAAVAAGGVQLREAVPGGVGGPLGEVRATLDPGRIFPSDLDTRTVGRRGITVVVDRVDGRLVFHPRREMLRVPASRILAGPDEALALPAAEERWTARLGTGDSLRVAVAEPVPGSTWSVVSIASVGEFAGPFRTAAATNLGLILLVSLAAAVGFFVLLNRTTASLVALTRSAERVASGDLHPELPPESGGEAGTLVRAFRVMVERIDAMLTSVRRSRQLAAVGEFSSQIAHEIRTPLTSIKMNLQGALRGIEQGADPGSQQRPLAIALGEAERLERVARGVLTLGRIGTGPREPVDPGELAREVVAARRSVLEEARVRATLELEAAPSVRVDRDAVASALDNLLTNAAEACGEGGSVVVRLEHRDADGVLAFHVRDDGPGVPPELRERIFDPFVTTRPRGHGFGLALAARAAEAHGGTLELRKPENGPGAWFVLTLPTEPEPHTPAVEHAPPLAYSPPRGHASPGEPA